MTRCANNDCVKIMCIVSCLWIIGWPLKLMLGYDDNSSLTAYYRRAEHDAIGNAHHMHRIISQLLHVATIGCGAQ